MWSIKIQQVEKDWEELYELIWSDFSGCIVIKEKNTQVYTVYYILGKKGVYTYIFI